MKKTRRNTKETVKSHAIDPREGRLGEQVRKHGMDNSIKCPGDNTRSEFHRFSNLGLLVILIRIDSMRRWNSDQINKDNGESHRRGHVVPEMLIFCSGHLTVKESVNW
jgi:hypothetical protein